MAEVIVMTEVAASDAVIEDISASHNQIARVFTSSLSVAPGDAPLPSIGGDARRVHGREEVGEWMHWLFL